MLKIGVIGVGHLGEIHINCIKEIESFSLAGFYDIDKARSAQVSGELNLKSYDSFDELLNDVDVVDVVTPTISHFEYTSRALRKSKHVFIEKPLAHTLAEAKELVKLTKEAGVKVQVGHVERFNPAFIAVKPYCSNPMFIESHRLAQFNPRGTDVSVILDLMIHDIDIVLSVVNSNIKKVSVSGVAVVSETPDIANARIEFDNGCVANLTASRISLKNMRKTRFFQRDAYISVDFLDKETKIFRLKNVEEGTDNPFAMIIDLGDDKGKKIIYYDSPETIPINAIKTELEAFLDSIVKNTQPQISVVDGFKALEVAHKIIDKLNYSLTSI
ncbi:MAG: Gfo/Idh/MocA family oxidoreductase [Bacteroidales bacterium]|nr:Gfo/Idh/MocA family oxidoreductase [Bacteroidales bacterium]